MPNNKNHQNNGIQPLACWVRSHIDYINRTSKHPERDRRLFMKYLQAIKEIKCQKKNVKLS